MTVSQPATSPPASGPAPDTRARLAAAGPALLAGELAVAAVWGAVAPYLAGPLDLEIDGRTLVETADQVLPAVVALAIATVALLAGRPALRGWLLAAVAGAAMTATHATYLVRAGRGETDTVAALFLVVPGVAVLLLALTAMALDAAGTAQRSPAAPAPAPSAEAGPDDAVIA